MRLANKVAIITGAARGIGRAIALRYAEEGCAVSVCDLNRDGAEATAQLARERAAAKGVPDPRAFATSVDVSKREDVERMVAETVAVLGVPHVLVNNAGIFFNAPFEEMTDEQWDRMMTVNVKSVFLVSQAVIRHWLRADIPGAIINLASISASVAFVNSSAYCTAKAGVASLTRCLALEYGPRGIRANSMAPGIIDTPMLPSAEDSANWAMNKLPLRRLGQPEDVADVALFLASADSRYVTGDMIYVDGGWMLE
jgi:NAD(P)-dependent dehydrogenase (short-subunit alcohol dehydrogenase family)